MIVSHGAEALLRRCLRSLRGAPAAGGEMRVTVVDSGSPDATPDMVAREFPEVRLLRAANIGFSAANNLALRESEAARCCCSTPTPRSTRERSTRRWRGCAPSRGSGWSG